MKTLSQILREVPYQQALEMQECLREAVGRVSRIDRVYSGLNLIKTAVEVRAVRKAHYILEEILADALNLKIFDDRPKDPRDSFNI